MSSPTDLELRIRRLVAESTAMRLEDITLETDAVRDGRICGDDVDELVEEFGKQFGVDVSNYHWDCHDGFEPAWNPLHLFIAPKPPEIYIPIRVRDLVESARCGVWTIKYPD